MLGNIRSSMDQTDSSLTSGYQSLQELGISTGSSTGSASASSTDGLLTVNTDSALTTAIKNRIRARSRLLLAILVQPGSRRLVNNASGRVRVRSRVAGSTATATCKIGTLTQPARLDGIFPRDALYNQRGEEPPAAVGPGRGDARRASTTRRRTRCPASCNAPVVLVLVLVLVRAANRINSIDLTGPRSLSSVSAWRSGRGWR